jgi:Domain of unknown function (DUF4041)/Meiotically up-regulated gene 113
MTGSAILVIIICLLAIVGFAVGLIMTYLKLQKIRNRFAPVLDVEKERDKLVLERGKLQKTVNMQRSSWEQEYKTTIAELEQLSGQLDTLRGDKEAQDFGLYEPRYSFLTSEEYKERLQEVRLLQKDMVKEKTAAVCSTNWTVEGSAAKGRTMTNKYLRLQLRAFNGECDAAVSNVKFNNAVALEKRIEGACKKINKIGETQGCSISPDYLKLKLDELHIVHEFQERKQEEKEEQRRIREDMREEERARKEIEKAQKNAERDEDKYNEALAKVRGELSAASEKKQETLNKKIAELERRLAEAHTNKARAIARAQQTKSGHVYVISNVGSFGDGIYKIGMTRRLEPMDRVKELGDASVPFAFDVHALIFSENAPSLENELHKRFTDQRLNLVNQRKEFFNASLSDIEQVVHENHGQIEFTKIAEAEEYRKTVVLRNEKQQAKSVPSVQGEVLDAKALFEQRKANWNTSS